MEHITAAEDYIRGMIIEKVVVAPPASDRDIAKIDAGIIVNETLTSQRTDTTKNNRRVASVRRPADAVSVDGFWAQLLATATKEQVHD
jgi:hypothetical protein